MASIRLCSIAEVPPGSVLEVKTDGREYVVCNVDGDIRVLDNQCPHVGGPLGQGNLVNGYVHCPWHAWGFDTRTGQCDFNPQITVRRHEVHVVDGSVVMIDD